MVLKHITCCGFFLLLTFSGFSQNGSIKKYLEDDDISKGKNIVKLNITNFLSGEMVNYERNINNSFSFEVGAGVIFKSYVGELHEYIDVIFHDEGSLVLTIPESGFGYSVGGKYFFNKHSPRGITIGLNFRQKHKVVEAFFITQNATTINISNQWIYVNRIFFEYNIGLGIYTYKMVDKEIESYIRNGKGLAVPIAFKIGYLL